MELSNERPLSRSTKPGVPHGIAVAAGILTGVALLPFVGMIAGVAGAFLAPLLPLATLGLVPAFTSALRREAEVHAMPPDASMERSEERHEHAEAEHRRAA